jgi:hypothetical protein
MNNEQKRPILVLLTSHWLSMIGVSLVTLAGISWLLVLPANIRGDVQNPYIGLLVFIAIPAVFFIGLALIPIGIALARRRVAADFADPVDRRAAWRRVAVFFAVMTLANVIIGSQVTYRAVSDMESVQFCGQSCHVMKPEYTAHLLGPHIAVSCAACHVAPGASGWVASKMAGTRQMMEVTFNNFPRPIPSAMESNKLVPSKETCEQCHSREKSIGPLLRVINNFKDDEANTHTETVLMMLVGSRRLGGIHGSHLGPGVHIRYATADTKRQSIPWVEYRNTGTGVTRTYIAGNPTPESIRSLPTFEMQCVDCHNRAAHSFELPGRAVDAAMARGEIPAELPFVKKTTMALLQAGYSSDDEAAQKIPAGMSAFYRTKYPAIATQNAAGIQAAGKAALSIYRHNVFPDLKVAWGTYPNNLGHTDSIGCFRCHDEGHTAADKKTITQDCGTCHDALAVDEASPAILKTLGIVDPLEKRQSGTN